MAADGHSPFNQSSSVKSRILRGALNAKNLESLGARRLAELLIEISTGNTLAKRRLRLELAGEDAAGKAGPTTSVEGDPLSGPTDVAGEHTVGRTSDPWRAFEAWLFHLPGRRLEIHGPLPIAAIAVVADIPYKSRRLPGVDRFLRGPHGHVPPPVRVHRAPPRAPPDRAFRCNGEPDDGVGRTADPRGIPVGHGAAVPDPRPGTAHTGNRSARP